MNQLWVGPMLDESLLLGSLTGAEAESHLIQSFHPAHNRERNTNARLKPQVRGSRPGLPFCSNPFRPCRACCTLVR